MQLTNSTDLAIQLEQKIQEIVNREDKTELGIIVFGFDPYDFSSISIWFLDEWEDYAYLDDSQKVATIIDTRFSEVVEQIHSLNDLPIFDDSLRLSHFYNRLRFIDEIQNQYYDQLENHRRLSLISAVQSLCYRRNLPEFDNLISLWVTNLYNGEHPELVSINAVFGEKELLPIEIEKGNNECVCWCRLTNQGMYFYCPDPNKLDKFRKLLIVESNTHDYKFMDMHKFGLEKDGSRCRIAILTSDGHSFFISRTSTGSNGILVPDHYIENVIYPHLLKHCANKEIVLGDMPDPYNEIAFNSWVNGMRTLGAEYGWRELENAVKKYGIIAALKYLPTTRPEDYLFEALHQTGVSLLNAAQCYEEAYHSYTCLSQDRQRKLWEDYAVTLIGLRKDSEFIELMANLRADESFRDWQEFDLRYAESFWMWRKDETQSAIQRLESIPEQERRSYYVWYEACLYSQIKPGYALKKFKLAMNRNKPVFPLDIDFRFHEGIVTILEQKKASIQHARGMAEQIAQQCNLDEPNVTVLRLWEVVQDTLRGKNPSKWQEIEKVNPQTGAAKYLFEHENIYYHLSTKGELSQINGNTEVLILSHAEVLSEKITCAHQFGNLLYVSVDGQGIVIADLTTAKVLQQHSRYFSDKVTGMAVDDIYMVLCTLAGVEIYIKDQENWSFVNLLGVGENCIPYSWAKDTIIIDQYLYVAAGNAGLLVFKLNGHKSPIYKSRIQFKGKQPFVDKLQRVDNYVLLNPNNGIWVVNIEQREKPVTKVFYRGTRKSELALPVVVESELWLVFDKNQPAVWEIDCRTMKQKHDLKVVYNTQNQMNVFYYYHKAMRFGQNQYLVVDNSGLSLIEAQACEALNTEIENQLLEKSDDICAAMVNSLKEYSEKYREKIGHMEIEDGFSRLVLTLFPPRPLAGMQGYGRGELIEYNFELSDFGIDASVNENWPYDELSSKSINNVKKILIQSLLARLSETEAFKKLSAEKVYLLSKYYHADIDRESLCVEKVIHGGILNV